MVLSQDSLVVCMHIKGLKLLYRGQKAQSMLAQSIVYRSFGYNTGFVQEKKFDVSRNDGSRDLKDMFKELEVSLYSSGGLLEVFAPFVKEHGNL